MVVQRERAQLARFVAAVPVWGGGRQLSGGHQNFLVRPPRALAATTKELVPGDLQWGVVDNDGV